MWGRGLNPGEISYVRLSWWPGNVSQPCWFELISGADCGSCRCGNGFYVIYVETTEKICRLGLEFYFEVHLGNKGAQQNLGVGRIFSMCRNWQKQMSWQSGVNMGPNQNEGGWRLTFFAALTQLCGLALWINSWVDSLEKWKRNYDNITLNLSQLGNLIIFPSRI